MTVDPEQVAQYLPLAGAEIPTIKGRVINVTHYIPYNCILLNDPRSESVSNGKLANGSQSSDTSDASAAPFSRLPTRRRQAAAVFEEKQWKFTQRRGHSAMYSGIQSLQHEWETVHIGWTGSIQEELSGDIIPTKSLTVEDKGTLTKALRGKGHIVPIFLDDDQSAGHYEGYCKSVLWPLFHYILWADATDGRVEKMNWNDYTAINKQFTDAIVDNYQPGDIVWIHDYHLLLVPQMLRERLPNAAIGLFVHCPFPSSEIFRCLPKRKEVLRGMLGANQIGFQTYSYSRHFISSCTRVLGYESTPKGVDALGHLVAVGTFPIGIDAERVNTYRKDPAVGPKMEAIREMYAGKKIIVGRDKLDLVKGVLQKLAAFEKFLIDYPEWRNKVVLIQVTSPALRDSPKLETKVSELVSHINGTYGSLEFTPVHHYHQQIDRDEYYALLSVADIGLITSVRDGMNTTSLEYIICQQENQGPLILSEFTGTAGSLSSAMMVNPWDYAGVAKALNDALTMSNEEKQAKHDQLYSRVIGHTASFWAFSFVKQLMAEITNAQESNPTPFLDVDKLVKKYKSSKKRLMFFDYDGTLTPIRKTPSAAVPPEEMLKYLQVVTRNPNNVVWVISGRDQGALDEWLGGIEGLGMSAEHGCFTKQPDSKKWINLTEEFDMSWKNDVIEIFTYYTERTQGSFIEHKRSSLTWHYRMADPDYGAFQAKECQNHLENAVLSKLPVEILVGKKNLEVRPTSINKGEIVKRLLAAHPDADFVLCAGDDKTDEDMFRALRKSDLGEDSFFAVTVGPPDKKTLANWHVDESEDVVRVIGTLAGSGSPNVNGSGRNAA